MDKIRAIIAGCGVQGIKRKRICGDDFVAFVDPNKDDAEFNDITEVPLDLYDAVLGCVPDNPKSELARYCLSHGKHLMLEKPFWVLNEHDFASLQELARVNKAVCYTAYNHRFEPHFIKMRDLLKSGKLGRVYRCRIFYGNGTARLVRESEWRDRGGGVLPDLGSHLLDACQYWFGDALDHTKWEIISANRFENRAPDHVILGYQDHKISVELEMTMLMWRNHFTCDVIAENGSAHIESLCKWGPSIFTHRQRVLPSGRPVEHQETIISPDPTWQAEYEYFKSLIYKGSQSDFNWDSKIFARLGALEKEIEIHD
ncbi:Gfo/Idh/MocA family oxidoreductase [Alphaproteobacteria bacterium]|nr:Gfo/Idh/MocA family oxidoreductase [Alphaproteobacteria bacterium]